MRLHPSCRVAPDLRSTTLWLCTDISATSNQETHSSTATSTSQVPVSTTVPGGITLLALVVLLTRVLLRRSLGVFLFKRSLLLVQFVGVPCTKYTSTFSTVTFPFG